MPSDKFIKKIKNYAVISFIVPLIAINSCLLIYIFLGDFNSKLSLFPNFNWNKNEHTYNFKEYNKINNNNESRRFTNCPKYEYSIIWNTFDNQKLLDVLDGKTINEDLIKNLKNNNKIRSVTIRNTNKINKRCINNYESYVFSLIKKFDLIDKLISYTTLKSKSGFVKIKNPYFYGEVSISRTARFFPNFLIFKPLIFLSGFLLLLYWRNNLNLFNKLKDKNVLDDFSKTFFYLGALSCIFLMLHALFFGLDIDSRLLTKLRRLIIALFIFFEVLAQIFLTKNLFILRKDLKEYINPLILKTKVAFVLFVLFSTIIAFTILAFGDPSTAFKHTLEWNYFSVLLCYYLLSRLLWK